MQETTSPDSLAERKGFTTVPYTPGSGNNTRRGWYFLYGSLMDPSTLAQVLQVSEAPWLHPARVVGYETRLWDAYPALIDGPTSQAVEGAACEIRSQKHVDRLIAYEAEKYSIRSCLIDLLDVGVGRKETVQGWMFMWAGEVDELQEGKFSLKEFLREKRLREM